MNASSQSAPKPNGRSCGARAWTSLAESPNPASKTSATVQRILSHAIQVFAARGDSNKVSGEHRNLARPWLNRLDEFVDARFFDDLQAEFESDDSNERSRIRKEWLLDEESGVVNRARRILREAEEGLPCPAIHRYRAYANAESLFEGRIRGPQGLAFLFADTDQGDEE